MTENIRFLLCTLICLSATTTSTSLPETPPTQTEPPTTTTWSPACEYNNVFYQPGEIAPVDSCNTGFCNEYGEIEPGIPCCENGNQMYKPGTYIYRNNCGSLRCSEDGYLEYGCIFCPEYCDENSKALEGCCPPCKPVQTQEAPQAPDIESPTEPPTEPTPEPPTETTPEATPGPVPQNPGETISSDQCTTVRCSDYGDVMQDTRPCPEVCDPSAPPDVCCFPCQTTITTTPEAIP